MNRASAAVGSDVEVAKASVEVLLRHLSPRVVQRALKSSHSVPAPRPSPAASGSGLAVSVDAAAGTAECVRRSGDADTRRLAFAFQQIADTAAADGGVAALARTASVTAARVVRGVNCCVLALGEQCSMRDVACAYIQAAFSAVAQQPSTCTRTVRCSVAGLARDGSSVVDLSAATCAEVLSWAAVEGHITPAYGQALAVLRLAEARLLLAARGLGPAAAKRAHPVVRVEITTYSRQRTTVGQLLVVDLGQALVAPAPTAPGPHSTTPEAMAPLVRAAVDLLDFAGGAGGNSVGGPAGSGDPDGPGDGATACHTLLRAWTAPPWLPSVVVQAPSEVEGDAASTTLMQLLKAAQMAALAPQMPLSTNAGAALPAIHDPRAVAGINGLMTKLRYARARATRAQGTVTAAALALLEQQQALQHSSVAAARGLSLPESTAAASGTLLSNPTLPLAPPAGFRLPPPPLMRRDPAAASPRCAVSATAVRFVVAAAGDTDASSDDGSDDGADATASRTHVAPPPPAAAATAADSGDAAGAGGSSTSKGAGGRADSSSGAGAGGGGDKAGSQPQRRTRKKKRVPRFMRGRRNTPSPDQARRASKQRGSGGSVTGSGGSVDGRRGRPRGDSSASGGTVDSRGSEASPRASDKTGGGLGFLSGLRGRLFRKKKDKRR